MLIVSLLVGFTVQIRLQRRHSKHKASDEESVALLADDVDSSWTLESAGQQLTQYLATGQLQDPDVIRKAALFVYSEAATDDKTRIHETAVDSRKRRRKAEDDNHVSHVCIVCGGPPRGAKVTYVQAVVTSIDPAQLLWSLLLRSLQ